MTLFLQAWPSVVTNVSKYLGTGAEDGFTEGMVESVLRCSLRPKKYPLDGSNAYCTLCFIKFYLRSFQVLGLASIFNEAMFCFNFCFDVLKNFMPE
jgi:hypothetical protein